MVGGHAYKLTDCHFQKTEWKVHTHTHTLTPQKVKLIFVLIVNERKCLIYLLRSTDVYLSLLIFLVYTCAIHYKFGHPVSAF